MIDLKKLFSRKKNAETATVSGGFEAINPVTNLSTTQRQTLAEKIDSLLSYLLSFILFLAPLLLVPALADWFDLPRQSFLLIGSLLALALWLARSVLDNKLPFVKSFFLLPVLLFAGANIVSALLSDNKILSLSSDPVLYTGLVVLFVTLCQVINSEKTLARLLTAFLASAAVLSVLAVAQNLLSAAPGLKSAPSSVNLLLNPSFSPTGSALSQAIFLAIVFPLYAGWFFQSRKAKTLPVSTLLLIVVTLGLVITTYSAFRQSPIILPQNIGWKIATSTMGDSLTSAFFGAGPGNFIDAFTVSKPVEFNNSTFWNLRFTASSNFYFYLLTTTGIAGLSSFLFLVGKILQLTRKRLEGGVASPMEKGLLGSLIIALVLFALLPTPSVALIAFFVTLAITTGHFRISENNTYASVLPDLSSKSSWLRPGGLIVALILLGVTTLHLGRLVLADYYFAQSLAAASNNRGTDTYNKQIQAISLNPWNDSYHVSYSQTNLALANALAGQPNLTDQQKQTVITLVQQAIRESRLAAGLAPKRAADWENLSLIYRGLINFAQGSDQWAIASQNQAITLDPTNPRLRLDLGGIYFALKDYQTAAQVFATAVTLKPDLANSHYNLAQAMKLLNLKDQAAQQLQLTANLVCAGGQTADCQKVQNEIQALGVAAQPPAASPSSSESAQPTLATPSSQTNLPKAQPKPPVKVSSPSGELTQ